MKHTDLTKDQQAVMLRLCVAADRPDCKAVRLVTEPNGTYKPKRETATGCALVRKGLARRLQDGRFVATDEGYWMGDALRLDARSARSKLAR